VDQAKLLHRSISLVRVANASVRLDIAKFSLICERIADAELGLRGVQILWEAVQKARPTVHSLTSIHSYYLRACLSANAFEAAARLLRDEILEVNSQLVSPKEALSFFYYAGMIATGLKRFREAKYYFGMVCIFR
jgi:hypothetical protein